MNLSNYYWYFESALTPRFCDELIEYAKSKKESLAITGGYGRKRDLQKDPLNKEEIKSLKKKRNSDVVWLNDTWIYKEVHPYVHEANKNSGWNFQWQRSESCQFTKYRHNQYYDWHCDSWHEPYKREDKTDPEHGLIRKLSMTCQLTDSSEYTGGELEFDFRNYEPHMRDEEKHKIQCKEILPKGSIIVFPSFVWHRVKPVTSGTRYSLVVWHLGRPFE
jgi:PKHD-type hydroxylase|tara:strand:+ start:130 stop:786 length:657 start_codon:yes stop_codon:yes gene_type:complete